MNPDRSLRLVEVCALAGTYLFYVYFFCILARGEQKCEA